MQPRSEDRTVLTYFDKWLFCGQKMQPDTQSKMHTATLDERRTQIMGPFQRPNSSEIYLLVSDLALVRRGTVSK